ncbi:MAG: lipid-A-disaccharide synthase [Alphaproteobacteria bacterium]|nr:lipid-A-disaccharide synthase [Alphaproteobacteria bacterium]
MTREDRPLRVFMAAGEASGDVLGGRLIQALKERAGADVEFHGVGGPQMAKAGLSSLFPISELAVMGLIEILPHARRLLHRIDEAAAAARRFQPDLIVTIDAPGFAHRFIDKLKDLPALRVHYVAPTVWAWKPKRVHKFKARYDHLMVLLPFEPPYFTLVGLPTTFVGHSVLEAGIDQADGAALRAELGLAPDRPLLAVLPGSRKGELDRHLPVFREAIRRFAKEAGDIACIFPTVEHLEQQIETEIADWPTDAFCVTGQARRYAAMRAANAALVASGTATLEMAAAGTPMAVAYRVNPLTAAIAKRMISVRYASIVNLLADFSGRPAPIPEYLQRACAPEPLAQALRNLFGKAGEAQSRAVSQELAALQPPAGGRPSDVAADLLLRLMSERADMKRAAPV